MIRYMAAKVLMFKHEVANRALFEEHITASALMTAIWGRLKDSAIIEVTIEGLSWATQDPLLELYLKCFGEIQNVKARSVMWMKGKEPGEDEFKMMGVRKAYMTINRSIPIHNIIAGDVVVIKHEGQSECRNCKMPKEVCKGGPDRQCRTANKWIDALEAFLPTINLDLATMKYKGRLGELVEDEIPEVGTMTRTDDILQLDTKQMLGSIIVDGIEDHKPESIWELGHNRITEFIMKRPQLTEETQEDRQSINQRDTNILLDTKETKGRRMNEVERKSFIKRGGQSTLGKWEIKGPPVLMKC